MRILQSLRACQSGAVAIEFAIVSLLLIIISTGVVEFGRGLDVRSKLSYAADVGARRILINANTTDSQLVSAVRSAYSGSHAELLEVVVGQETVNGISFRTVAVSYPFNPLIPKFATIAINISVNRRVPAQ